MKEIATNRKALHNYEILDTLEAGLVLTGPEIKAIRAGQVNLTGSYARLMYTKGVSQPELFWVGGHIAAAIGDATRSRKLLVHQRELTRLIGKVQEKSLTLIPLRLYFKRGYAKMALGLGKGKKLHDKRETLKERDALRALRQEKDR